MLHACNALLATVIGVALLSICAVDAGSKATVNLKELEFMTELNQRAAFDDFVLKFDKPFLQTPHGDIAAQTLSSSPLLATLPVGMSQVLINAKPCALLLPHWHPRASELAFVTKGELFMGFLEEIGGGRFISAVVKQNESMVFPQGLPHFVLNTGCKEAQFLATLPTSDPGQVTIAPALFSLPNNVLRATFGFFDADVKKVAKGALAIAAVNPSVDPVCAKRCRLKY